MITMASLNIKKIIKITLCITLLLCITSCKSKDKNTNTPNKIDVSEKLDEIINNGPPTSSNPYDYIESSKDTFNELLANLKETFEYAIKDLINTDAGNGLKSYIEALLCLKINTDFVYDFESAPDYLKNYKKYLASTNNSFSDFDKYTQELLKNIN